MRDHRLQERDGELEHHVFNTPLPRQPEGRILVLLTRSYRNLPHEEGRTYLASSHATPADKIDFTDADALKETYRQGRRDMRRILERT